jgi:hypothetical protein
LFAASAPLIQQAVTHKPKKKKKKVTVTPTMMPLPQAILPAPVEKPPVEKPPTDWKKYAMWGAGILVAGGAVYFAFKRPEPDVPKKNPTRRALDFLIGRLSKEEEEKAEAEERESRRRPSRRRKNPEANENGSEVRRVDTEIKETDSDFSTEEDFDV